MLRLLKPARGPISRTQNRLRAKLDGNVEVNRTNLRIALRRPAGHGAPMMAASLEHSDFGTTAEAWARAYVESTRLAEKRYPPPLPKRFEPGAAGLVLKPGRPRELRPQSKKTKSPRLGGLSDPKKRAQLLHTFFHHELQAAELMAWAVLRFPETPLAFRRGLLKIAGDEIRHLNLYAEHIERLGFELGDFPVNDWFWSRIGAVRTPTSFVATLGMGFEGGNLDHGARFVEAFENAGDLRAAEIQALVLKEEIPHVAFALHWFRKFEGTVRFQDWLRHLVAPLSPLLMRGAVLNHRARVEAGFKPEFLDAFEAWEEDTELA